MNNHIILGKLGEDIACRFLKNKGFEIVERNYRKKWGEIDIVCQKKEIIHFVEVKATSLVSENVIRETGDDARKPEDNVHFLKVRRLSKVIQSYLSEKHREEDPVWQLDILAVYVDLKNKTAKVRFTENLPI